MNEKKEHTEFVVGGVYSLTERGGVVVFGTLLGASIRRNGAKVGRVYTATSEPVVVMENSATLDEWTLVSVPLPADVARGIIAAIAQSHERYEWLIADLVARVSKLEVADHQSADGEPTSRFSPALSISDLRTRRA
jgi:hypothetical protein